MKIEISSGCMSNFISIDDRSFQDFSDIEKLQHLHILLDKIQDSSAYYRLIKNILEECDYANTDYKYIQCETCKDDIIWTTYEFDK